MITSQITIGMDLRPCGACGSYVPATGCGHWKPLLFGSALRSANLRQRKKAELHAARNRRNHGSERDQDKC